mmetsp:Transcript_2844/g.8460  ORF Transcript_2844/g.8460 Transcript_2844/m.8460 type:complete len:228 (+) Transcript_2844:404-1087(+)
MKQTPGPSGSPGRRRNSRLRGSTWRRSCARSARAWLRCEGGCGTGSWSCSGSQGSRRWTQSRPIRRRRWGSRQSRRRRRTWRRPRRRASRPRQRSARGAPEASGLQPAFQSLPFLDPSRRSWRRCGPSSGRSRGARRRPSADASWPSAPRRWPRRTRRLTRSVSSVKTTSASRPRRRRSSSCAGSPTPSRTSRPRARSWPGSRGWLPRRRRTTSGLSWRSARTTLKS